MSAVAELSQLRKQRAGKGSTNKRDGRAAIFFLAPWFIGLALIVAGPLVASHSLSFTDYNLLQDPHFIGGANYKKRITDQRLGGALTVRAAVVWAVALDAVRLGLRATAARWGSRSCPCFGSRQARASDRGLCLPSGLAPGVGGGDRHPLASDLRGLRLDEPAPRAIRVS